MADQLDIFAGNSSLVPGKAGRCVPFGKYKDQPVEIILGDPQYALWLLGSMLDKLQHQYPDFLAFLVSRFGLPDRTPAHNQIQNRFLDEGFALRFALACSPAIRDYVAGLGTVNVPAVWAAYVSRSLAEASEEPNLTKLQRRYTRVPPVQERLARERDALAYAADHLEFPGSSEELDGHLPCRLCNIHGMQFEHEGADVAFQVYGEYSVRAWLRSDDPMLRDDRPQTLLLRNTQEKFRVEVKPIVGDDYPAILRAMKAVKDRQLLVGEYVGAGATWSQVVQVFGLSGIQAVLLDDVEQVQVPESVEGVPVIPLTSAQANATLEQIYSEFSATLSK
jgi:hypothetical protein